MSTKLAELDPTWVALGGLSRSQGGLVFRCPAHPGTRLMVKCIFAGVDEMVRALQGRGVDWRDVVLPAPSMIWSWVGQLPDLTVAPSVDAGPLGVWKIENGWVRMDDA